MSRQDPQLKIRLPLALKEKVEAAAAASGRSLNAEIVAALQGALGGSRADQTDVKRLQRMAVQVDALWKWMQAQSHPRIELIEDSAEQVKFGDVGSHRHTAKKTKR